MTRKLIVFCLALSFIVVLPAKDVKESSPSVRSSGKDLTHELSWDGNISPVAMSQDGEVIPLANPIIRRAFNNNARGLVDTLSWGPAGTVNFGFFPGDIMVEWYQAPTDLTLYGVGVDVYVWNADANTAVLKVEVYRPGMTGYPYGSDGATYPSTVVDGAGWLGYAHEAGNDTVDYPDPGWTTWTDPPGASLVWNNFTSANGVCGGIAPPAASSQPLMGAKVLPAGLIDATISGGATAETGLHYIDFTDDDGADFESGEWFGVAVTYLPFTDAAGEVMDFTSDARIGLLSGDFSSYVPRPGTKYYDIQCDGTSANHGWHVRHYSWRMAYAVELTGDMPPTFTSVSALPTTLSIGARSLIAQITDSNPSGGTMGVASATFNYQLDSLTATVQQVAMTNSDTTAWLATVPGQAVGTGVYWSVTAFDVGALSNSTMTEFYTIFEPTAGNGIVFNNQDRLYGQGDAYILTRYMNGAGTNDLWDKSYGNITAELVANYDIMVELGGHGGPQFNSDAVVSAWWDGSKTFIATGDEWLGARLGWTDGIALANGVSSPAGSVISSIFGIETYYSDISGWGGGGDGVSRLEAIAGDPITGALHTWQQTAHATIDTNVTPPDTSYSAVHLNYAPVYEVGGDNWMDGFEVNDHGTLSMHVYAGLADSAILDSSLKTGAMVHVAHGDGGRAAFMAFDPIALNTVPTYYWVGAYPYSDKGPLVSALAWAASTSSTEDEVNLPSRFALKGNYPNPFNPSTNIAYSIDMRANVNIKIFSLLGEEIATLYSGNVVPGTHEVKWNGVDNAGHAVASGVYIYRVEADKQALTGKMMLLK